MSERTDLIEKAKDLNLDFAGNISTAKLTIMVNEASGPAVKAEEKEEDETESAVVAKTKPEAGNVKVISADLKRRQFIAKRKAIAMKTRVVTITNKDNRENDVTTTAPLSFENQHFGIAKNVPLDMPVELEQALIDIAESTCITHHKDEIVNGKRTGNKVPVQVKKYVVSYAKEG